MARPKRIQMTRHKPWRSDNPDAVIVARPTIYGNPFKVGFRTNGYPKVLDAAHAVDLFRKLIERLPTSHISASEIAKLRGKDLACWCPLDQPCHADVLLELANNQSRKAR